ncbi:MAG: hypothetical protein R6V27_05955, partial [Balneolaceae bacterium]
FPSLISIIVKKFPSLRNALNNSSIITYDVTANRFVRHMVRRLVGTMLQVGTGKSSVSYFEDLLYHPNPAKSGHGVSAKGLILQKVGY